MYLIRAVRALGSEVALVVKGGTPAHGALRERVAALFAVTIGVDLVCAVLALLLERHVPQTDVKSFGSAFFWTTTQLLTISSQIHNPVSFGGRVLDIGMEAYAMIVVATLTGSVGAFLVHRARDLEREAEVRHTGA